MIFKLIDKIDEIKGVIIAIFGAATGTTLKAAGTMSSVGDNIKWFDICSPILQTIAWCVAIVAGVLTIIKTYRDVRSKKRNKRGLS